MSFALTPDQVLATTRAVRRRLDLTRSLDPALIRECLELARQAPTASNSQPWQFVVVTDPVPKLAIARCYRVGWEAYAAELIANDPAIASRLGSAQHLADHLHEVPAMLIPCVSPRPETVPVGRQPELYGSVMQASWSFCLAARARGLGTCWTTLHLGREREVSEILGIPYDDVAQLALIPVAHSLGTDFKPAPRGPLDDVLHWDRW